MQIALTIAGFDPSSGAGVTADLMVFAAHGLYGTACITALTVQSTLGVESVHAVPADVIDATLGCLDRDLPPAGIKIGMLLNASNTLLVVRHITHSNSYIADYNASHSVVLDPVLRSSSGRELLDPDGVIALQEQLLPVVDWITPNIDELAILASQRVETREDVPKAARALQLRVGSKTSGKRLGIFATGGHLETPDDFLLTPDREEHWLPGRRIETSSTHGTGCVLSSAFLSRLILGDSPLEAAQAAKLYVAGALGNARGVGHGTGPVNPFMGVDG